MTLTLGLVSVLSIYIPSILGLFCINRTHKLPNYFVNFIYFMTFMSFVEAAANYLFYSKQSNFMVYLLALAVEGPIILLIQAQYLNGSKLQKITRGLAIGFTIYYFLRVYILGFTDAFEYELRVIECILLIFTSGVGVVQQSSNMKINILYNPTFLLSFSLLLFYAATLFVNAALLLVAQDDFLSFVRPVYKVHSMINIFTNVLIARSIWLSYRQTKLLQL